MNSLLFALGAVSPIMLTVIIGYLIKRIGVIKKEFAAPANRLVFRLLLPAMLFLNVYKIESLGDISPWYLIYAAVAVLTVFILTIPAVLLLTQKNERRGVLIQATFRSNYALIGIPLAESLFGAAGVAIASLLSALSIPLFNILAVISLSVFGEQKQKIHIGKILLGIVKNPLIQGIACGIVALGIRAVFVKAGITFRLSDIKPLYTVLGYLSNSATPLALLMLGVQFEFSAAKELRCEILFGTAARCAIVPALAIGIAYLFFRDTFTGAHFAAFVGIFTTPVAVSTVPMAQEMKGDATLAGQLVVWTTLFSALSVFLASFLLRAAGVF